MATIKIKSNPYEKEIKYFLPSLVRKQMGLFYVPVRSEERESADGKILSPRLFLYDLDQDLFMKK